MTTEYLEFRIIPILGRKTDVPQDDFSLFQHINENTVLTHDVGGVNFDITRKKNACYKSEGYVKWSNSATSQATKCLGLYELVSGSTRDHIFIDNGKFYYLDSSLDPQVVEDGSSTTFATGDQDIYSFCTIGAYVVFADRAEHAPMKWKHGDATLSNLMYDGNSGGSGTEYKFRYVVPFQRRVIGLYSDQTNGDIDVRWSSSWPGTAITALNFPALNQLYIPNDDSITGAATMGHDRCYIYCQNSIHQLVYYADYSLPFRIYTTVQKQGCESHHSIVNLGDRHLLFNRNYGFCEYRGGQTFPYGGKSISDDIEDLIQGMNADYYHLIVGTFIPLTKEVCWTVPLYDDSSCNNLLFYNIETKQWRVEDKTMRYVDEWRLVENFTWNDLITEAGGTGLWTDGGVSSNTWAYYSSHKQRLVYANTDGYLYNRDGTNLAGSNLNGYRIEPIMTFGNDFNYKTIFEVWFGIGNTGSYSIRVYHRSGNTVGELIGKPWATIGTVSCDSSTRPVIHCSKTGRYHQILWGTEYADEEFMVTDIVFKYIMQSNV